jgi:SH3-like domain-containing protein
MRRNWVALPVFLSLLGAAMGAEEQSPPLPVPRFVSIKFDRVNLRSGPGPRYPTAWVLTRRDMPVEVVQEYDTWRKIRDWEGTEGWVAQAALQARRSIIVAGEIRNLRGNPSADAPVVARAEPGVIGRLDKCPGDAPEWCEVDFAQSKGWIRRGEIWGVFPAETYPPSAP